MALKVLKVNKVGLHGPISDGSWHLVLLRPRVRHGAVVVSAIRISSGRTIGGSLVNTTISSDGSVGDVRGLIEIWRVEGIQG